MAAKKTAAKTNRGSKSKSAPRVKPDKAPKGESRIPRGRVYEEKLPCEVPAAERIEAGKKLAHATRAYAEWREKRKLINIKGREERVHFEETIEELSTAVEAGEIERRVDCQDFLVTKGGDKWIEVVRLDTKEVVLKREPTPDELQEGLPFEGSEAPRPKKGKAPPKEQGGLDFPKAPAVGEFPGDDPPAETSAGFEAPDLGD